MNDTTNNNTNKKRRPRNNNRRPSGPRKNTSGGKDKTSSPQAAAGGGQSASRPKRRPSQNKNRRPKNLSPVRILQKYDNLLDQHLIARRKFFEVHGRITGKQLDKVQQNFERTLRELRKFENGLKDWQKEVLEKKINTYPEDKIYSVSNGLPADGELVPFAGEFEDPHLLPTQKESFKDDTEESSGSIEDYYSYKGIEPPVKEEEKEKEQ